MTRSEAIAIMSQQFGYRTDLDTSLITYLQLAQVNLEKGRTLPWWLRSERSYIYTTSGEPRIPLPNDFLREDEGNKLTYVPSDSSADLVTLDKDFYDQLEEKYQRQTGSPKAYAIDGEYFRLFPIPDAIYQIRMIYAKKDTVLTSNIENKWLKHLPYLIMGHAGRLQASALRDADAIALFSQWEKEGLALMYAENEAREHINMDYQIGGPH